MQIRRKAGFFAFAIGTAAIGAGMFGAPQTAQAGVLGLSEQEEIRAGQQMRSEIEAKFGRALPQNHAMSRRARSIGMQFARLSTRKNIPYSYTVLQNDKVLNAFAGPGGPIYVTTKLMRTAANDAELAYVLGHETAHTDRKHLVNSMKKQQQASIIAGIAGAILGRGRSGNTIGAAANIGWAFISSGYSRKDENDADAVGVRMMARLGYDPRAAVSMLGKLGGGGGSILASHPDPKSRRQTVTNLIQRENLLDVAKRAGGPRLASNFGTNDGESPYQPVASTRDDDLDYDSPDDADDARIDDSLSGESAHGERIDFTAPLRVSRVGNSDVLLAPIDGFAQWSGARLTERGNEISLRRADYNLTLRRNSSVAYLNREGERERNVTMLAPVTQVGGTLYAPLSWLAQGLGGRVSVAENRRVFNVSFPDGPSGFVQVS